MSPEMSDRERAHKFFNVMNDRRGDDGFFPRDALVAEFAAVRQEQHEQIKGEIARRDDRIAELTEKLAEWQTHATNNAAIALRIRQEQHERTKAAIIARFTDDLAIGVLRRITLADTEPKP